MKIIALTGGIASGKTTVARLFTRCGAKVLDADRIAHGVYRPGTAVYGAMLKRYGREVLHRNGRIDRNKLGKILFGSPRERKWLESVVHPQTRRQIAEALKKLRRRKPPLVLVEAALHVETGYHREFQGLIVVHAKPQVQLQRLMKRDKLTEHEARQRLRSQLPLKKKRAAADWVIDTSESLQDTKRQVIELYKKLTR
jgi:dephospho-CoA kinase